MRAAFQHARTGDQRQRQFIAEASFADGNDGIGFIGHGRTMDIGSRRVNGASSSFRIAAIAASPESITTTRAGFAPLVAMDSGLLASPGPGMTTAARSLHRRERRRLEERAFDIGDDRAVLLGVSAHLDPGRVGLERAPYLFALGERFPGEQIMQVVAAVADQHRPEAGVADAVLLPDLQRVILEPLEQSRQLAGDTLIDAEFVDHCVPPHWQRLRAGRAATVSSCPALCRASRLCTRSATRIEMAGT